MDLSARRHMYSQSGWTLMELLIVMAIIALLAVLILLGGSRRSLLRANDARRKSDLTNTRRAFEEYYSDKDQFPATDILDLCNAETLSSYSLKKIPCDPTTGRPYLYVPEDDTDLSQGYRVCAKLQDKGDPDITAIGCHPDNGCGWGEDWNYCLASGTTITASGFDPLNDPEPTPTPSPILLGNKACTPGGQCDTYDNPANHGCPASFAVTCPPDPYCQSSVNQCDD